MLARFEIMQYYCIMVYVKEAAGILKRHGYRITAPRKTVIGVLGEAEGPLSPYDIQKCLRANDNSLNHVTIYRILDLLCSLDLVHRVITAGGFMRCTLVNKKGCHRHMICRSCGSVTEFADESLCEKEDAVVRQLGFYAEHHITEFLGLCSSCYDSENGGVDEANPR